MSPLALPPDTSTPNHVDLLRVTLRGHVQASKERKAAALEEFQNSGLTMAGFAKLAGINYQTFYQWVNPVKKKAPKPQRLVEAVMTASPPNRAGLTIEFGSFSRVTVCNDQELQLAAKLIVLVNERSPAC